MMVSSDRQTRLPDELLIDITPRRIAMVALVPLLLLALINAAMVTYLAVNPFNKGYWLNARKWDLLAGLSEPVDTLILGDSSCNQGVDPVELDRMMGGRSINLCTIGNSVVIDDAWMLGAYVDRFGPPARVVVVHAYDVWPRDERMLEGSLWTIDAHRDLWQGRTPQLDEPLGARLRTAIAPWVPLYTQETTIRELLMNPQRIFERRRFATTDRGYMKVVDANPGKLKRNIADHEAFVEANVFSVSQVNDEALRELARLAREGGFPLYVANSPLSEALFRCDQFRAYYDDVNAYLLVASGQAKFHHLFFDPMLFPASELESVDHVTHAGAHRYTEQIVAEIKRMESRP